MTLRQEKLNTLFKKLIARFTGTLVEDALVTITHCDISRDLEHARILISVYPEQKASSALSLIRQKEKELMDFLKKNTRIKKLPYIVFNIDKGEQNRQRISDLLRTR